MTGNVTPIDSDTEVVGKTASELMDELTATLDSYAGNISNVEAVGAMVVCLFNLLTGCTTDYDEEPPDHAS